MATLLSDPHLGLRRKAGMTDTPLKNWRDRQHVILAHICQEIGEDTLIITGDLFDDKHVDNETIIRTIDTLSIHRGRKILLAGNHDLSRRGDQMSSFELLSRILPSLCDQPVAFCFEPTDFGMVDGKRLFAIPHLPTQEEYDAAIREAPEGVVLLTHANLENPFALDKDHSLNLTLAQAEKFEHVYSGHEHNGRTVANVTVVGAILPKTIAEADSDKHYLRDWSPFKSYTHEGEYIEVDWLDLESFKHEDQSFIRVVGSASFEQGPQVIQAVDKFRRGTSAFWVANSVNVEGLVLSEIEASADSLEEFDVMRAFWSLFNEEQARRIRDAAGIA